MFMKKILFFIVPLCNISGLWAQITHTALNFPYYDGYTFTLSGENTTYDIYNSRDETVESETHYFVSNHSETAAGRKMTFTVTFRVGEEETTVDSWLVLNKKGMAWGINGEKLKPTQAIRLPVTENTEWTTSLMNIKAKTEVLSTDTIIDTYKGAVHAFAIRYTQLMKSDKQMVLYQVSEEYYTQYWGKIGTRALIYAVIKETGDIVKVFEQVQQISDCNLSQEFLDKVPFADKQ
jgi:hypothetical protein